METRIYSIGKRRKSKKKPVSAFLLRLIIVLLALLVCLALLLNFELRPAIISILESKVHNDINNMLSDAVVTALEKKQYTYADLTDIQYKSDGTVSTLSVQMPNILQLRSIIVKELLYDLKYLRFTDVQIPIGNLFKNDFFAGRGPNITVRVMMTEGIDAYVESHFQAQGINQTLHSIVFRFGVTVQFLLPSKMHTVKISDTYPIAQSILLGEVPDAYTEIHRLTDNITEEEIDDIYDFGAY